MVKYFCDRCGAENTNHVIDVYFRLPEFNAPRKYMSVCIECYKEILNCIEQTDDNKKIYKKIMERM